MKAWLFQDTRQKAKHGDKAPWSVGYYDPNGKKRSKSFRNKSLAEKYQRKVEGQLAAGTFEMPTKATWERFMAEYESTELVRMGGQAREAMQGALNHFERLIDPQRMSGINAQTFSRYTALRISEGNPRRKGADHKPLSPATINKELRHLRVAIRKAVKWGYLNREPAIEFLGEPEKLPTYVSPEEFQSLYAACEAARWPEGHRYPAADWWRGLLVTAYMTGWRIGALLALRWEDTDLDAGTVLSRAADNKGKRDQVCHLHPLAVEHMRELIDFSPLVFPWVRNRRRVFEEFERLQRLASLTAKGKHHYSFHDLRRGFATMNADRMTADALQGLMQHRSYETTKRYVAMARQLKPAVANLYTPELPRRVRGV